MNAIFSTFRNLKLSVKAMVSPVLIIGLLLVLGVISFGDLASIEENVKAVTQDLAPDAGTATKIMRQVYRKRLQVKDYIKTAAEEDINRFDSADAELKAILRQSYNDIQNPQRVELIKKIETLNEEYNQAFHNKVVANMHKRNELVHGSLDAIGPKAEEVLTRIMDSAYRDGDASASYHGGVATRHLTLARLHAYRFLVNNDAAAKRETLSELEEAKRGVQGLLRELENPERQRLAREVLDGLSQYATAFQQVTDVIATRNDAAHNILDAKGPIMANDAVALSDSVFASLSEQGKLVEEIVGSSEESFIMLTLLATVAGLVSAYLITRSFIKPLHQTNLMLQDIAEGEGDLTKRVPVNSTDEVGQLGGNFNRFVEKLQGLISHIAGVVAQLATAAEQLAAVTLQTSKGVQEQKMETEQVATAMTQMNATVQEVAQNTDQAADAARQANQEAEGGNRVVGKTIDSIVSLADGLEEAGQVIAKLKGDSENIGTVLDVIKTIAEQTNLLALNAAIEAARAGEQGRGFAVVADEVRTLAQRTQKSTTEIERLIETLQGGAEHAVSVMEQSRDHARETVSQATLAGESLATITQAVQTISEMSTQIASAATEQGAVTNDINHSVINIRDISEQTAAASEQTAASSTELAHLGEELRALVQQFKV